MPKAIKMPPINYRSLAKDVLAAKAERQGVRSGRFSPSVYVDPAAPEEARAARETTGMKRPEFAEALGVSPKTVIAWECGQRRPDGLATKVLRRILSRPGLAAELARSH